MQVKTAIPGLKEANKLLSDIKRLGIHDVEPMYDKDVLPDGMWAIVQVFRPSGKILLLNEPSSYETQPIVMFWCKDKDGKFRVPNDQDLSDIVVIVKRAQVWFDKGSDYMIDQIETKEKKTYDENRQKQSERIRSFAPSMKKAIRKELL